MRGQDGLFAGGGGSDSAGSVSVFGGNGVSRIGLRLGFGLFGLGFAHTMYGLGCFRFFCVYLGIFRPLFLF